LATINSASIPFAVVSRISAGAVAQGVRQDVLLSQSLIEPKYGDDRDRISPVQLLLLSMNANRSVEDATHGLGVRQLPIAVSVIGLRAIMGSSTLEAALQSLERLYRVSSSPVRLELAVEGGEAILKVQAEARTETAAHTVEDTYLTWMFMHCSRFLGHSLAVNEVRVRDPGHVTLGGRHFAIGAPTRLGGVSALRFRKSLLASKRGGRASDTPMWDCMRPWVETLARASPPQEDNAPWRLSVDQLAKRAGVSSATMRRQLDDSDGGYRVARRRALAKTGVTLLQTTDASVESVAAELGYADARSFRRFLKEALGKTPIQFRSEASNVDPRRDDLLLTRARETALLLDRQ
jgi:AraC-like DNA-binding protein